MTTTLEPAIVDEPALPAERSPRLVPRFVLSLLLGLVAFLALGAGALYAYDQQYVGRILPGVRVGSTELGGLTREEAEARISSAYGWIGTGQVTLTGPDGQVTTVPYADLGRGPDTSALLDAALGAGRRGAPVANLFSAPRIA